MNWLTSWRRFLLTTKVKVIQLVKKFPAFYRPRRFITVFTRACHWSLSTARWVQSTSSHSTSIKSILISSSHLCLGYPTKLLYVLLIFPMCSTFPTYLILLDLITIIIFGEVCKLWSFSLCSALQHPATPSLPRSKYSPQHPQSVFFP